jgi:hypothetical protein
LSRKKKTPVFINLPGEGKERTGVITRDPAPVFQKPFFFIEIIGDKTTLGICQLIIEVHHGY